MVLAGDSAKEPVIHIPFDEFDGSDIKATPYDLASQGSFHVIEGRTKIHIIEWLIECRKKQPIPISIISDMQVT